MPSTLDLDAELHTLLNRLTRDQKLRALGFVEGLLASSKPRGIPPSALMHLRGTLSREEAEEMKQIIEEECERINPEAC